jgi:hypothetical protein
MSRAAEPGTHAQAADLLAAKVLRTIGRAPAPLSHPVNSANSAHYTPWRTA